MDDSSSTPSPKGNTKNIVVIGAFLLLIIVIIAVALAKIAHRNNSSIMQSYNSTPSVSSLVSPTPTLNPAVKDTSDSQLDKDMQNVQSNLDKFDTQITNVNQGIANTSQDSGQQQ